MPKNRENTTHILNLFNDLLNLCNRLRHVESHCPGAKERNILYNQWDLDYTKRAISIEIPHFPRVTSTKTKPHTPIKANGTIKSETYIGVYTRSFPDVVMKKMLPYTYDIFIENPL